MIEVTTLDNRKVAVNAELIERVEAVPETVLTLTTGKKLMVRESVQDIINRFINYKRTVMTPDFPDREGSNHEKV